MRVLLGWLLGAAAVCSAQILDRAELVEVASSLSLPVAVTHAGDGSGRLFVCEKAGVVRILAEDGAIEQEPFLDLRHRVGSRGVEQGLYSVAFAPDYPSSGRFFVSYSDNGGDLAVARYRVSDDPARADPSSGRVLLLIRQPADIHQGGQLAFGPDGLLYVSVGDGGDNRDGPDVARDLSTLLGKILRLDVSGEDYSIPSDNPYVGRADARGEVFASGLRNPWRFSFDRATGDLYLGDVGDQWEEEIDVIPAGSGGGQDFGWRTREGARCFDQQSGCLSPALTPPILRYAHSGEGCYATIGGFVPRGLRAFDADGDYLFGDFCLKTIFRAERNGGVWVIAETRKTGWSISSFGEGPDGEIYVTDLIGGAVYRLDFPRPAPRISALEPPQAGLGRPALTLRIVGEGFTPESQARWNGRPRTAVYIDPGRIDLELAATDFQRPGNAQLTIENPEPGGGVSEAALFEILAEPQPPEIASGGVVNAAGFSPRGSLAPGTIVALFGQGFAAQSAAAAAYPLPTQLSGVSVEIDGIPAPLFFASWSQINLLLPHDLPSRGAVQLRVRVGERISPTERISLAPFSPGLFTVDPSGGAAALIAGSGGLLAAPSGPGSRPIRRGETLELFASGLGAVTFPPEGGSAAAADPLVETETTPLVRIGALRLAPVFAGLTPGFSGLYQINITIPEVAPVGDAVPLSVTVGGVESNPVLVAIE